MEREPAALMQRELQAAHQGTGALAGQASLETLNGMHARGAIVIARDDETAAARVMTADEPDLMIAVGVSEEKMTAVVRSSRSPGSARDLRDGWFAPR